MSKLTYTTTPIGLEVVILNDGSAWVTQSSYARFVGLSHQAVNYRSKSVEIVEVDDIYTYQIVTAKNFAVNVKTRLQHENGKTSEVVLIPASIFGMWLAKDNPELFSVMIEAGATQYLYSLCGHKVGVINPVTPETDLAKLINAQSTKIANLEMMVAQLLENQTAPAQKDKSHPRILTAAPKYTNWIENNLVVTNWVGDVLMLDDIKAAIVKYSSEGIKFSSRFCSDIRNELVNFHGWVMNGHATNRVGKDRKTCMYGVKGK